ncbi:hypothetical protein ABPG74_003793 [Tetrahymena malaccensis]
MQKEKLPKFFLFPFGDIGVGKTTIIESFITSQEDRTKKRCIEVIGSYVYEKCNQKIQLVLFDLFQSFLRFKMQKFNFFKEIVFLFLVYDITNRDSFDFIQSERRVSHEEGLQLASQYGFYFYEISALQKIDVNGFINDVLDIIIQTQ